MGEFLLFDIRSGGLKVETAKNTMIFSCLYWEKINF